MIVDVGNQECMVCVLRGLSSDKTKKKMNTYEAPVITNPQFASHLGVDIYEDSHGSYGFTDKSGERHIRNRKMRSKRERLEWIKHDIAWYRSQGWV